MKRRDLRARIDDANRIEFPRTVLDALEVAALCLSLAHVRLADRGAAGNHETLEEEIEERLTCDVFSQKIRAIQTGELEQANRMIEVIRETGRAVVKRRARRDAARAEMN